MGVHDIRSGQELEPTFEPQEPPGGGDGGNMDGMDARVANLEAFAADAKQRLARVETKLDHIEKEVSQFKWWIVAQILAGILAVLGTGVAIQQMTVTTFEAAAKASASGTAQPIVIQIPTVPQAPAPAPAAPK